MQRNHALFTGICLLALIVGGLSYSDYRQNSAAQPAATGKIKPARVEPIPESGLNRLILTPKTAERLGIQTAQVRDEKVTRNWLLVGEVVAVPEATLTAPAGLGSDPNAVPGQTMLGSVLVRLAPTDDLKSVARDRPGLVLPLKRDEMVSGFAAKPVQVSSGGAVTEAAKALVAAQDGDPYYLVEGQGHGLAPGQRVGVQLPLADSGTPRKVIPYAALFYDPRGAAWTYTNPAPLVFVRHRVKVDYIEGDLAVLSEGPPSGTAVVTVGVAELFGVETKVGY